MSILPDNIDVKLFKQRIMKKRFFKRINTISAIHLLVFVCLNMGTQAQQDPGFTQYMYNTLAINPAYAGTEDAISIIMLSRHQWLGFDGAPQTQSVSVHGPLDEKFIGLGFSYSKDRIGPVSSDNVYADYAFRINLHEEGILSFGLKTGASFSRNSLTSLSPIFETDPTFMNDEPAFWSVNFGTGMFYYTPNFYLGLSVPRIRSISLVKDRELYNNQRPVNHYLAMTGYVWDIDPEWKLKPSLLAKYVAGSPISLDINLNTMYKEMVVAGLSHRLGDSFGAMLQMKAFSNLWIGYAYDFTITPLKNHNTGTHELLLLFDFFRPEVVKSPRFF
jgi:type IX secretion system PorP/SprF family membrane protein